MVNVQILVILQVKQIKNILRFSIKAYMIEIISFIKILDIQKEILKKNIKKILIQNICLE